MKKKRIFSVLMTVVLTVTLVMFAAPVSAVDPIIYDLAVNDENPWTDGAFTFTNIEPGGEPMAFDFKLHNVGDNPGILTFSMGVSENDMAGAPAPNMSADEFASLVYVEAVHYQYIWLTDPEGPYTGSVRDDLPSWLAMDSNSDGKVSLYEICQIPEIPYGDYEGDQLEAGAEITYFIEFQLGGSLVPFEAGGAILTEVEDNSQGDGVSVTIVATLGTDIEQSSGNVFQVAGTAGPVLNETTDVTYDTIQLAIDAASPGDTISVAAGTYNEDIVIGIALTLQGANAGVPATETRGPESIIDAIGDAAVSIDGVDSITFDGFTVGGFGKVGIVVKNVFSIQIEGNIVSATDHSQAPNGIQVGYIVDPTATTGTIKDNQVSGCSWEGYNPETTDYEGGWTGSGILVIAPNSALEISGNEVQSCDVGMDIETGSGTLITGNDVHDNSYGFVSWNEDPSIQFNNIYQNALGGVYRALVGSPTGLVDAINNWWGHSSGPGGEGHGSGDTVSTNVNANPWLLTSDLDGDTYDKTVALNPGWSIVSPGAELESWIPVDADELKYAYDNGAFVEATDMDPITPMFIKTEVGGGIGFNYLEESYGLFSTDLEAGWNLIGVPETNATAEAILSPIRLGVNNEVALATLASQGNYNPSGESFYESMLDLEGEVPELYPFDGYWAYMNVTKEFGVIVVPQ